MLPNPAVYKRTLIVERIYFFQKTTKSSQYFIVEWFENCNLIVLLLPNKSQNLSQNKNLWHHLNISAHSWVAMKLDRAEEEWGHDIV